MAKLEIKLHPKQIEVYNSKARFKVLIAGRRWGKSLFSAYTMIISALQTPNGVYFLVSPSYPQTKIIWRMIKRFLPKEYIKRTMEGDLYIELINGALIFAKSADNVDSLRGEGLNGVILDEAAFMRGEAWTEAIRPALADKNGWAVIISTPKGRNHLFDLYMRGLDETQNEYKSFHYTTYDNPLIPPAEIEEMSKSLPEITYKQEILAEFVEGGGLVFRGVDVVMTARPESPIPGVFYIIGVDLGRHEDFTVISVGRVDQNRQVYMERFNRTDWDYIKDRIRFVHAHYNNSPIIIDSTGYGDPVYEDLAKEGINITGININVSTKPHMIENLQLLIENQQIVLLKDRDASLEFSAYTYTLLPSGHVRYEAPKGAAFHDDIVMGVALMAMGFVRGGGGMIGEIQPEDDNMGALYDEIEDVADYEEYELVPED